MQRVPTIDSCGSVTFDPFLKSRNPFSFLCFLESSNIIVSVSNFQTRILAFWWVSATFHPFIAYKWRPVLTSVNVRVFCNLGDTQQCQYQHFFHTTQDKNIINKNLEIIWKTVTCRLFCSHTVFVNILFYSGHREIITHLTILNSWLHFVLDVPLLFTWRPLLYLF